MKNNIFLLYAFAVLSFTNCTKEQNLTEPITLDFQTGLVGSWQFVEKGVEVAFHEGHVCNSPMNMSQDKIAYSLRWDNVTSDEKRIFKKNGAYSHYLNKQLTCQGSYKIDENGVLDLTTECQSLSGKVVGLKTNSLIIQEGDNFFKFQKVD